MNRLQAEEKSRLALYLNQNGCPVQLESSSPGLVIEQVSAVGMNMVFDLNCGRTGYLLDALITSRLRRSARIKGIQIKTPWGGSEISLLHGDPRYLARGGFYLFRDTGLSFPGSQVLNRLLSGRYALKASDEIEGLIMAIDAQRIPDNVSDNDRVVVELSIFDGPGNRFSSQFKLCVDRSAVRAQQRAEQIHQYFQSPRRRKRALVASRKQEAREKLDEFDPEIWQEQRTKPRVVLVTPCPQS